MQLLFLLFDLTCLTWLHLGVVHPLQDVALYQCPPLSIVQCSPAPGSSLFLELNLRVYLGILFCSKTCPSRSLLGDPLWLCQCHSGCLHCLLLYSGAMSVLVIPLLVFVVSSSPLGFSCGFQSLDNLVTMETSAECCISTPTSFHWFLLEVDFSLLCPAKRCWRWHQPSDLACSVLPRGVEDGISHQI